MDDTIHVALAVYDPSGNYSRHAGVVMESVFSNTKSKVCVHILHDETLSDINRNNFIKLSEKHSQEVDFVDVTEYMKKLNFDVDSLTTHFSRGTLFRLFILDLLTIDKVIYLDCDVIVNRDIKELWDIDVDGHYAGVVIDEPPRSRRRLFFCKYLGIDSSKYFNAGIMLINQAELKKDTPDLVSEALEFFLRYPGALLPDQDFLNKKLFGHVVFLDRKFNYLGSNLDYSDLNGKIWHLAGKKPWDIALGIGTDALYWKYYEQTPWCGSITDSILAAWTKSKYSHEKSASCFRKVGDSIKNSISPKSITPIYMLCLLFNDIIFRIKKR